MGISMKRGLAALVSVSMVCMAPLPAVADEPQAGSVQELQAAAPVDAEREAAVQELVTSSLQAGAAASSLEKATDGAVTVDFENLAPAPDDAEWVADAEALLESFAAETPQLLAADEDQAALMDAQGQAVNHAIKMAQWSIGKGRATDLGSEATYMYMSHYIDIGSNYWSAGSLQYLLDGPARSNTQPFLSQWLLKADRDAYKTYLATTQGTKQLAKVGDVAIGSLGVLGTANEVRKASGSLGQLSEEGYRCKASVSALSAAYDASLVNETLQDLTARFNADREDDPTQKLSILAQDYIDNSDILAKYDEMAKKQLVGIVLGMGAGALLAGAPVAALGAGAVGLVAAAATVSLYMASDIYSYVAWAGMRYGWSTRYSMRLYEQLFG